MTNKEWFEKNDASFADAMKCYNPDDYDTFDAFLMAEHKLKFKVGMIVAGVNSRIWQVNIITAIDHDNQRYCTKFFCDGVWYDGFIQFEHEYELEYIGVVNPIFLANMISRH